MITESMSMRSSAPALVDELHVRMFSTTSTSTVWSLRLLLHRLQLPHLRRSLRLRQLHLHQLRHPLPHLLPLLHLPLHPLSLVQSVSVIRWWR